MVLNDILGKEMVVAPARLGTLSERDLIVDPDLPMCYLYGLTTG